MLCLSISIFLSWLIIPRILVVAFRKRLFDISNERKVHRGVVPRLGGLSFTPTILFSMSFVTGLRYLIDYEIAPHLLPIVLPEFYFLVCGMTLLYLAGIKDDLVGLRYRTKFVIQIIAACMLPISGLWINNLYGIFGVYELTFWIGIPFTILVIVFITNAINLIDGIDGLASGLSMISLIILGILFISNGMSVYAMLAFATCGVLFPFFYYNVFGQVEHCKKIFMGDTGSLTLGYVLAFLAIRYASYTPSCTPYSKGAIIVAFSTLIIPMFDVVRVMLVRARMHKNLFQPDKNHIHHKFLAMGFSARKSMILILGMATCFSCLNILLVLYIENNILFFADILVWICLNLWFDKIRKNRMVL